jgi:hypothetical protein
MDLIQNFMDKESGSIISELISQGFSAEQANRFLPEALATLMQGLKGADLFGSANSDGLTSLSDSVDFAALSARTGVDSSNAETGLKALIPCLIAFLKDNRGLPGLLGEQAGGLTSVFKSLHH